jgi:hypothetical protein
LFTYTYNTAEESKVRIRYVLSGYWIDFGDGDLPIDADKTIADRLTFDANGATSRPPSEEKLAKYATLFLRKTEKYLDRNKRTFLGDNMITKMIRMTADNLNQKEQIVLNKSALLSCELDDLLR